MFLPETLRRSLSRTSLVLGVAGLAMVTASITALATLESSSAPSSGKRTMILSEDEAPATEAVPSLTTTTTAGAVTTTTAVMVSPTSAATIGRDDIQDVRLEDHEERLTRLETTTTTIVAVPVYATPEIEQVTTTTVPTTTTTTIVRTRDTMPAAPSGEWVEVARWEGQSPAGQNVTLTTGILRCRNVRTNGEADPERVYRIMPVGSTPREVCFGAGVSGQTSPVVKLYPKTYWLQIDHASQPDWAFGTALEEYRCIDHGCAMPAEGSMA